MGLEAIYQKPNTSRGHPDHKVYLGLPRFGGELRAWD
jgi:hypothetical protein